MASLKLFECTLLNPGIACTYSVTGDESYVVDQAVSHEVNEHGFDDTPTLRKNITDSLVDVQSNPV